MSKENKSVNENNATKQHLTQDEIAKLMGIEIPSKKSATSTKAHPLKKVISDRVNEVIHETLCTEFSEYFYEIGETMVQHTKANGDVLSSFVKGYQLVLPSEESTFNNGKLVGGFKIGKPQMYCQGLKTQETPYVIKNGKTIFYKDSIKK